MLGDLVTKAGNLEEAEFDQFAEEYRQSLNSSVAISGESADFFAEYKILRVAQECRRAAWQPDRILDFGTGVGSSLPYFREQFPSSELIGADVSEKSLEVAQERFGGEAQLVKIADGCIPLADNSVSLAFSACVFHHIPEAEHIAWLSELRRVVRPGGMLVIFEHNPLNPLTVRTVKSCPFDENAVLMTAPELTRRFAAAGWASPTSKFTLFFPRMLAALRPFERFLGAVPLGAQYFVSARNDATASIP